MTFSKIIKFSIWDEDSCETLPSLFFIIEKFDAFRGNPEKDFLIWQNPRTPIAELFNEANDLRRCRVRR
ncbi:Uncharacterised protein [Pseudomonas fragi]|uniref:Uncharacterized protein n=1 Tax=Pseudomonas fragi TaxID=296 RepID=A0A449IME9_PSEFR|nr:Uncharacterised protein [Pseudomonas fragi]